MKSFRSICLSIFALTIFAASCSSPTSVAEKALKLVGKGTFVPTDVDKHLGLTPRAVIFLTSDYGDIFDNALQKSYEAEYFRKNGVFMEFSLFDFSDVLFERFELISKEDITTDLYGITNYDRWEKNGMGEDIIEKSKAFDREYRKDYQENENCGTWLVEKDVPEYILRYKLDNRYIANISVVKCPDTGYRVCAFRIE